MERAFRRIYYQRLGLLIAGLVFAYTLLFFFRV